ncbi:restriction endonuclease [Streptomyces sp. NBC_01571]|uniref:restriction endonuclease n=1 Tax=Streptomyces sp. NBC_01571 TaxID=2975883 RepID=UPI0022565892|nr:restriction endonuclease [Streptomyces sp. NBC_01571]MCX4578904.1 restriction endonuclease [Streptomyces sp. NBC_01571]
MPRGTLSADFERLRAVMNAQQRGRKFEQLLERLFQQAHFRVDRDAGISAPRQTDLVARYGNVWYLIEAKWQNAPADVDVFDAVFRRLERAASSRVVGVIVSVSGFTDTVINEAAQCRGQELVLLLGEEELAELLAAPASVAELLQRKREQLVTHGRVHLAAGAKPRRRRRRPSSDLPASDLRLLGTDLAPLSYAAGDGGFTDLVFVQELPDVDWVPAGGSGVCLDLPIGAFDENGLADLLHALTSLGWTTSQPQWSIQQATRNWHGVGAREFLDTLRAWEQRYDGLDEDDVHHTEKVTYVDTFPDGGGFYTLAADVSSHPSRRVQFCHVSFQLTGIPLDTQALRHLFEQFDAVGTGYFRPMTAKAVTRGWLLEPLPLEVVGYLVSHDPFPVEALDLDDAEEADLPRPPEEWVIGIVAKNPFRDTDDAAPPDGWPGELQTGGIIVCSLRSHHPLSDTPDGYRLYGWEQARTTDALVLRPVADW